MTWGQLVYTKLLAFNLTQYSKVVVAGWGVEWRGVVVMEVVVVVVMMIMMTLTVTISAGYFS